MGLTGVFGIKEVPRDIWHIGTLIRPKSIFYENAFKISINTEQVPICTLFWLKNPAILAAITSTSRRILNASLRIYPIRYSNPIQMSINLRLPGLPSWQVHRSKS